MTVRLIIIREIRPYVLLAKYCGVQVGNERKRQVLWKVLDVLHGHKAFLRIQNPPKVKELPLSEARAGEWHTK